MFAYPYGDPDSYNKKIIQYVKDAGFTCACALGSGNKENNLFNLKRINMDKSMSSLYRVKFSKPLLAAELSGLSEYIFLRKIVEKFRIRNADKQKKHFY